ncbi:MAG: multicopper oxidase domain-containing protein [Rariglobus sp.]
MQSRYLWLVLAAALTGSAAQACPNCGGADPLRLRELEPKATQRYPDAPVVDYTLNIAETTLAPARKLVRVLTLNGTVPGPVLRFREGDVARIRVNNQLAREETSVHWHGLLLPNVEDGVPHVTTPVIPAGGSRTFEFLLKQAGTYWYHSHTGLQEQRGIYGSIVIEPKTDAPARTDLPPIDRDEVLVLSDWTNENPYNVLRTLHRGSDWYAIRKGTAQSLFGAYRAGHLKEFFRREKSRLLPMDVSDVAYDAFLINGLPRPRLAARPGETLRLRVINAAASTYFYLSSATGPLTLIAADGIDVAPIRQNRLLLGMAETYDVLVTVPADAAPATWEIRVTAQDNSGHASLLLGDSVGPENSAPAPGPLEIYAGMDATLEAVLNQLDETSDITDAEALATENARPLSPYTRLQATRSTALPAEAPTREVTLKLTGDMARYLWSIDDQPIDQHSTIAVKRGEILRLVLVNNTMMHHPMHLHGHFFRVLMPGATDTDRAPLKHTVDVPPMSRRVIEFYADEDRDWLFHCHLLYHMMAGMARVVSYPAAEDPAYQPMLGEHGHAHTYAWLDATLQTHMSTGLATVQRARDNINLAWELGWERVSRREYEIDATYSHYFNPRWTAFAGYRLTNQPGGANSVIAGANYLLPYLVDATLTLQSNGEARLGLAKTLPLTARLGLFSSVEYDTAQDFSWQAGLTYTLTQTLSLIATHDSHCGTGAGIALRF